jgi:protein TonB
MAWRDEDLEAFMRQFRPEAPPPLARPAPARRGKWITAALGTAAALGLTGYVVWPAHRADPRPNDAVARVAGPTSQGPTPDGQRDPIGRPSFEPSDRSAFDASRVVTDQNPPAPRGTVRVRAGRELRPPRQTKHVAPVYPEAAKAKGIEGVVILEIVIGTDGRVIQADVTKSTPALDESAVAAVHQWEYEPALLNGEPVEVILTVSVRFTLKD